MPMTRMGETHVKHEPRSKASKAGALKIRIIKFHKGFVRPQRDVLTKRLHFLPRGTT
jgi:hypothetical protein